MSWVEEGRLPMPLDAVLEEHGHEHRVTAVAPNLLAAAALAVVHGGVARAVSTLMPIREQPEPLPPPPIVVAQVWHPRCDGAPAHVRRLRTAKALRGEPRRLLSP